MKKKINMRYRQGLIICNLFSLNDTLLVLPGQGSLVDINFFPLLPMLTDCYRSNVSIIVIK